jgi:hypothetical protein
MSGSARARSLRAKNPQAAIMNAGSQIHNNSALNTARPQEEKKEKPIGDTWMNRHGKK